MHENEEEPFEAAENNNRAMFKDLTESEIAQMLAFSLESFSGDKNSVIGAIQSLNPQFIQVLNLYK